MNSYNVTMRRSPTITDEEAQRRLRQVYTLLLELARKTTDGDAEVSDRALPTANAPVKEPEVKA